MYDDTAALVGVILENTLWKNKLKENLIGDKFFYRRVFMIVLPMIVQNTITNVVSLLDNIMVGRIGTLEMSAVAIINQLLFVFNLCIFGGLSGAGIFSTQFAGAKDDDGVRNCFRIKVVICIGILFTAFLVFGIFPKQLIGSYLAEGTSPTDASATLGFALNYLKIMTIGIIPFAVSQIYSSSLREVGETKLPMYASIAAIFINILFNYLLIFGKCGFPRLGVAGAAIATVFSRFVEMTVVVVFAHKRRGEFKFLKSVYRSIKVPKKLWADVVKKGSPILINEFLWSTGVALYLQCYSVRGLHVVAAANIASTVVNLFNVVFISIGSAVAIMVGQCLGANEIEKAKQTVWRLIALALVSCFFVGGVLALLSGVIPNIYNTEQNVKQLAKSFLLIVAFMMPVNSFVHNSYFTLRSGGKTIITFFFDSGYMWGICVPVAYIFANYTNMNVVLLYLFVNSLEFLKAIVAFILVKKGVWINNIVR